ncbi:MAG: hypothetical protein KDC48_07895 [Planctomycetes bacterium]|nr:hypothetical protein [Planctomycetota bacterium]
MPTAWLLPLLCCCITFTAASAQAGPISTLHNRELVVQGRFVDEGSGAPLSRCEVRLSGLQSNGLALARSAGDWCDPEPITTGDDGRFRFVLRVPAANEEPDLNRYQLRVSHAMHVPWFSHCTFAVALAQGTVDYGDVRLPEGVRPRIRCVDTNGALQPGVRLVLRQQAQRAAVTTVPYGPQSWWIGSTAGVTDIDGYLHLDDALQPGTWTAVAQQRGVPAPRATFALPSRDAIDIVVDPLPTRALLCGRLVDADGEPVADALLTTKGNTTGSTRSLRDGRFVLYRAPDQRDGKAIVSFARDSSEPRWSHLATLAWGETNASITVPGDIRVRFEVTTTAGTPLEAFNLYCQPLDPRAPVEPVQLSGTFAAGRVEARLTPGDYRVLVYPRTDEALPGPWEEFMVTASEATLRLRVPVPTVRAVRVTRDGAPVADALVEVITGDEPGIDTFALPLTALETPPQVSRRLLLVASAPTGADGLATLAVARDTRAAWLRVSGRTIQTRIVHVDAWPGAAVEVPVAAGAVLVGAIGPVEALFALDPEDAAVRGGPAIHSHQRRLGPWIAVEAGRTYIARPDPLGRFELTGLPPGRVRVLLGRTLRRQPNASIDRTTHPLGTFDLTPGKPTEVKLTVPAELLPK